MRRQKWSLLFIWAFWLKAVLSQSAASTASALMFSDVNQTVTIDLSFDDNMFSLTFQGPSDLWVIYYALFVFILKKREKSTY